MRLVEMEKQVAIHSLRIGALEGGSNLTNIVGDIVEIKELIKGTTTSPGLMQKVDRMDSIQQKMIWSGVGFAFCIPLVVTVFVAIFPRFYDIHFEPRDTHDKQQVEVVPRK